MAAFETDIFANRQVFENSRDHFPGSTDTISDVLLGKLFGNKQGAIAPLLRQVHQHIGDAAVNILECKALNIRRELTHAAGEVANKLPGNIGMLLEHPTKIFLHDNAKLAFLDRAYRC